MAAAAVIADDDAERASSELHKAKVSRIKHLFNQGRNLTDAEAEMLLDAPPGAQVNEMLRYAAVGTPDQVREQLDRFAVHARADELILAPLAGDREVLLGTVRHLAPKG